MASTGLIFRPLSAHIGAEVSGLDLSAPLSTQQIRAINSAFLEYVVLLFRGQRLAQEQLVGFAGNFGQLGTVSHPLHLDPGGAAQMHPNLMMVSNIRHDGKPIGMLPDGEMHFHHDKIHREKPDKATMLYAVEVPSSGGDTLFSSGYAAYHALEPGVRARLEGLRAFHSYDAGAMVRGGSGLGSVNSCEHPVFRTHDETRMRAVYVNRLMTRHIEGLDPEESELLLEKLFAATEDPRFVYRHQWQRGDLIMWDNRCSSHARTDFPADQRRLLWRATVQGDVRPS